MGDKSFVIDCKLNERNWFIIYNTGWSLKDVFDIANILSKLMLAKKTLIGLSPLKSKGLCFATRLESFSG